MDKHTQASEEYLDTLLKYYEDEVSGEAYFYGLAEHFAEREKTILLAQVERRAAEAVRPLLNKYGLEPRDESVIHNQGKGYVQIHQSYSWPEFMTYIIKRYPGYLDDFAGLENLAPAEDLPALILLTGHEVAVIEFAEMELAGDPDTAEATPKLLRYLARNHDGDAGVFAAVLQRGRVNKGDPIFVI